LQGEDGSDRLGPNCSMGTSNAPSFWIANGLSMTGLRIFSHVLGHGYDQANSKKMNERGANVIENKGAWWETSRQIGNLIENKCTYKTISRMYLKIKNLQSDRREPCSGRGKACPACPSEKPLATMGSASPMHPRRDSSVLKTPCHSDPAVVGEESRSGPETMPDSSPATAGSE